MIRRGELANAEWHLFRGWPELQSAIRDVRHAVQFNESPAVDWDALLALIDPPARAAAAKG